MAAQSAETEHQPAPGILLVALDDTIAAEHILRWTLENVYRSGDEVRLLHVIAEPVPDILVGGGGPMDAVVSLSPDPKEDLQHISQAKAMMAKRFIPICQAKKVQHKVELLHFLTDEANIGAAICTRAAAVKPRLVVMGKHNRSRVAEFLLGSACAYATQHCKQPLVVIHDRLGSEGPSVLDISSDPQHEN